MRAKATLIQVEPAYERILGSDDEGRRLDKIVRKAFPGLSLSFLHKALRTGSLRIDGKRKKPDYLCRAGEKLESYLPGLQSPKSERFDESSTQVLTPELIILETADLLFVNKPAGVLVHDGSTSLASMAAAYIRKSGSQSVSFKPGPLHRLDRNTSGLVTFSKTLIGATTFSRRIAEISKTYLAILEGDVRNPDIWEDRLERNDETRKSSVSSIGDLALTRIKPLASTGEATLAELKLDTGRTHQIRVQAAAHGHPLVGDVKYGGRRSALPYYLHAWMLGFENPFFEDLLPNIIAPVPHYFFKFYGSSGANVENAVYSYLKNPDQ